MPLSQQNQSTMRLQSDKVTVADTGDFSPASIDKIDAAIKILQEFRKKYLDAEKMATALNK